MRNGAHYYHWIMGGTLIEMIVSLLDHIMEREIL